MTEVEIENGIYEAIRLKLVSGGYIPDVTTYIATSDRQGYEDAIQDIKDAGGKIVYVENSGSYLNREGLEENCIIIDQEEANPSQTGTKSINEYTLDDVNDNYKKEITTNGLFDLQYRVTIVCYDSEYLAIMQDIIRQALGFRIVLTAIDNDANETGTFNCWRRNYLRLDSNKFMERAILFDIPTVDLIGNTDDGTVARAEEISIRINTNKEVGNNPDDMITVVQ